MMTKAKPKTYKVAIYFRDTTGVWHYHDTWDGEANSPADAKYKALDAMCHARNVRSDCCKAEILPDRHKSH